VVPAPVVVPAPFGTGRREWLSAERVYWPDAPCGTPFGRAAVGLLSGRRTDSAPFVASEKSNVASANAPRLRSPGRAKRRKFSRERCRGRLALFFRQPTAGNQIAFWIQRFLLS